MASADFIIGNGQSGPGESHWKQVVIYLDGPSQRLYYLLAVEDDSTDGAPPREQRSPLSGFQATANGASIEQLPPNLAALV
jgi:hypothetical protein